MRRPLLRLLELEQHAGPLRFERWFLLERLLWERINQQRHSRYTRPWRRFYRITLPLLMPNLLVVLVLALIRAVQVFDEIFVLTGGGPGSATLFIVQFIYQTAFAESIRLYGLAAAASLALAGTLLVLTLVQLRISRQGMGGNARREDG